MTFWLAANYIFLLLLLFVLFLNNIKSIKENICNLSIKVYVKNFFFEMNNKSRFFKMSLIMCCVFCSCCFLIGLIYAYETRNTVEYRIIATGDFDYAAKGKEVRILGISIDGVKSDLIKLASDNGYVIDQGNLVLNPQEEKIELKFIISSASIVKFDLYKHEWSGIAEISRANVTERINLYSAVSSPEESYQYKYIPNLLKTVSDFLRLSNDSYVILLFLFFISTCIFLLCMIGYLNTYKKMKAKQLERIDIIIGLTSAFIICLSTCYVLLELIGILVLIIDVFIVIYMLFDLKEILRSKIEYAVIILIINLGIMMLCCYPFGEGPDEMAHSANVYYKSFFGDKSASVRHEGLDTHVQLPVNMYDLYIEAYRFIFSKEHEVMPVYSLHKFISPLDSNITKLDMWIGSTDGLSVIPYMPAILTYLFLRLLPIPPSPILIQYIARFVNLCIWTLLIYHSIKITPRYKRIFFITALFAISIQQGFGISQDCITNATFILLTAMLLKEIYLPEDCKIFKKTIINIVIISAVLGMCKPGYCPGVLLVLLIGTHRFSSRNEEIIYKFIMMLPAIVLSIVFYYIVKSYLFVFSRDAYEIIIMSKEYVEKNSLLFVNIIDVIKIYFRTAFERMPLDLLDGLNSGFGWSTKWALSLSRFVANTLYILLVAVNIEESEEEYYHHNILFLAIFAIIFAVIYAAFGIDDIIAGNRIVNGLQPRYFIPAVLFLYMGLQCNLISIKVKNLNFLFSTCITLTISIGLYTILTGYYVFNI